MMFSHYCYRSILLVVLLARSINSFIIPTSTLGCYHNTAHSSLCYDDDSSNNGSWIQHSMKVNDDEEASKEKNKALISSSMMTDRRNAITAAAAFSTSMFLTGTATTENANAAESASSLLSSPFEGTYSDPNHPGGKRIIKVVQSEKAVLGDFKLAEVQGIGGLGEPKSFVLPAVIIGDRAIVIDFTPKGGPKDFTAVLKGNGIKFIRDGNQWPRL
mmetsp:Transcript_30184/g.34385  ORF Transcript_30184/g.34385 Transcript_30184/m.34385 type:complete len:216 (-) Transcript_30184:8-655(-)